MDERERGLEEFLDPQVVRRRLLVASLYICAFEVLKDCIVDRIRDFFSIGFDENGMIEGPKYRTVVLALHHNRLRASLLWLMGQGIVDQADVDAFLAARDLRNAFAHDLVEHVGRWPKGVEDTFDGLVVLLNKIERWWIVNVEIPTNPDFDGEEVDVEGVVPGSVLTLRMLRDIALAPDDEAGVCLAAYRAAAAQDGTKD
jgi:hypothetical protein